MASKGWVPRVSSVYCCGGYTGVGVPHVQILKQLGLGGSYGETVVNSMRKTVQRTTVQEKKHLTSTVRSCAAKNADISYFGTAYRADLLVTCHLSLAHGHRQTLDLKPVAVCSRETKYEGTQYLPLRRWQHRVGCERTASTALTSAKKTAIVISKN